MEAEKVVCEACKEPFEVGQSFCFRTKRPIRIEYLDSQGVPLVNGRIFFSQYSTLFFVIHEHCG